MDIKTTSIEQTICQFTGARDATRGAILQNLWSGYGEIVRYLLEGGDTASVVVKQIAVPEQRSHPRGWQSDRGHQRKLHSYAVEAEWYRHYASHCGSACRVATCFGVQGEGVVSAIVLQDLDAAGFSQRLQHASANALYASVHWLACFHAQWLGKRAVDLWPRGSYWHLATRPDELAAMPDGLLKSSAASLNDALESARFKTLVHGDAKIANFCYSDDHQQLAAVDFQYVGAGVGVSDLVYFLGSCLSGPELEQQGDDLLELYLQCLVEALLRHKKLDNKAIAVLCQEWRNLYSVAWADFERFLQGWSPAHPKLNSYSARQTQLAIEQLQGG